MNTRLVGFGLMTAFLLGSPDWGGANSIQAATIMDLVDNNGGMIAVGPFTFTFTATSVGGDRTSAQVSVAAAGNNGIEFTIDPILRLDSMAQGVAKNLSIDISYTVTSTVPIVGAGLADNAFAQFKLNGAYSQVTETLDNGSTLFVGSGATNQANVSGVNFPGIMTLDVANAGRLFTPPRGAGDNQDEAQLGSITNTFIAASIPVPSTLVMSSIMFGMLGVVWSYKWMKQTTAA